MKFKTIFILFNAVIVISFLFIFILPLLILGFDYAVVFWKTNWSMALVFVFVLSAINVFFMGNWRIFTLVGKEDWNGLSAWLTEQIFVKKRYRGFHVRFLVSVSLNKSDLATIDKLETELADHKPAMLRRLAVLFGSVYLLRNKPEESERFFSQFIHVQDVDKPGWLWFDYAFSLILLKRAAEAVPWLRKAATLNDVVLVMLCAYFLGTIGAAALEDHAEREAAMAFSEERRAMLCKRFKPERLSREIEAARNEVHIVILSKLVDDAGSWLFNAESVDQKPV